jgi:catechol 2,3-dioxygenase-like lactoylglutathione lyase family enzyme
MPQQIQLIALLVHDYDEALRFYTGVLGFQLIEDICLSPEKRWIVVRPNGGSGTGLLLARAVGGQQKARVGDQTGGRVFLFLETEDFRRDYAVYRARGVRFLEEPRQEPYGTVAVFEDLYGNRWDLIQQR